MSFNTAEHFSLFEQILDIKLTFLQEFQHSYFSSISNRNVLSILTELNSRLAVVNNAVPDGLHNVFRQIAGLQMVGLSNFHISLSCVELSDLHLIVGQCSSFSSTNLVNHS